MHVHAPDDISVAHKATAPTGPGAPFRLLLPVTAWTAAAGSSLTAAEAHDADPFTLLLQVLLVLAILPLRHALVMMASSALVAHPMWIAHVEPLHPCGTAEVDHLPRALVPQVPHPAFLPAPFALLGVLQAPPPFGAFATAGLQASKLTMRLVAVPLDGADASPGDDQPLACAGRHGDLVDFALIGRRPDGGGSAGRCLCCGRGMYLQVQLITAIPDQGDCPHLLRQVRQMERAGFASSAHRQDEAASLPRNGLSRPLHGHVLLRMMGVAMAWVALAQLLDCLDVGQKLLADHLDRLTVQRNLSAFGFALQVVSARPGPALAPSLLVPLDTVHPHPGGFHLRCLQACAGPPVEIFEGIDAYGLHNCSCLLHVAYALYHQHRFWSRGRQHPDGGKLFLLLNPSSKARHFHPHLLPGDGDESAAC